jgi:putative phosphoesterase
VKIGLIADIHAEPQALRRVLTDMPSVDRVLCAGDAVSEYQFCPETVELLQQVKAQCIQGNHEMVLFSDRNATYLQQCQAEFPPALLNVLAQAPVSWTSEEAGRRLLMVHASPWKPFEGYVMPRSPYLARFAKLPYDFVILGHTHVPMVEQAGSVTVINPGSCSQPRDHDRRGSYAVLDLERRDVAFYRVRLD